VPDRHQAKSGQRRGPHEAGDIEARACAHVSGANYQGPEQRADECRETQEPDDVEMLIPSRHTNSHVIDTYRSQIGKSDFSIV
jgi:hypothetical protein